MNKFSFLDQQQFIEFDNFDENSFLPLQQTDLDLDQLFVDFKEETNFNEEISFFGTDHKYKTFETNEKEEKEKEEKEKTKSQALRLETNILVQPTLEASGQKRNKNEDNIKENKSKDSESQSTINFKEIIEPETGKNTLLCQKDPLVVLSKKFFKRHKRIPEELMTEKEKKLLRKMNKEELKNLSSSQRIERKRARDRVCARSARQKRKEYIDFLQSQINGFNKENVNLSEKLKALNGENRKLKSIVGNLEKLTKNTNIKYKRKKLYQNILLQEINF
ncbi:b-zip transcription factor (eurofung) [Anaeramoeba flamelloides]|uniref:B-zip transcription factor (Eurofung) n=1 Tax=Anaeramoeba flamelloides TaxID=1746091 RepID=A0AAV7YVD5_9EUKA|nr:b-zip transcription factor (eurofung) [Anaeramoeba flamelloides]